MLDAVVIGLGSLAATRRRLLSLAEGRCWHRTLRPRPPTGSRHRATRAVPARMRARSRLVVLGSLREALLRQAAGAGAREGRRVRVIVAGPPAHAKECVVPTGTLELIVNLVDDEVRIYDAAGRCQSGSGTAVAGAYRRPFMFDTRENASAVGVHLGPGYAGAVLGVPPGELLDRHVDLEALWGRRARELRDGRADRGPARVHPMMETTAPHEPHAHHVESVDLVRIGLVALVVLASWLVPWRDHQNKRMSPQRVDALPYAHSSGD